MRGLPMAAAVTGALGWGVASAWGSTPNANSIACPRAPAGWVSPAGAGGRSVLSPTLADAVPQSDWEPQTDQVTVMCGYTNRKAKTVRVTVNYALPTADFNPFADFDVGCSTSDPSLGLGNGAVSWNTTTRTYRVLSLTGWAYAGFTDPTRQLASSDVSRFEAVARTLLNRSVPAAHACTLPGNGGAASPPRGWTFVFHVQLASVGETISGAFVGSFLTSPDGKNPVGTVSDFATDHDLVLTIVPADGSTSQSLDLRLDNVGFNFTPYSTLTATATVVSSTDPACGGGATGTLVMSSQPAASLNLCGGNLLQGTPTGSAGLYVTIG